MKHVLDRTPINHCKRVQHLSYKLYFEQGKCTIIRVTLWCSSTQSYLRCRRRWGLSFTPGCFNTRHRASGTHWLSLFFLSFSGWGETESTWYVGHCWSTVPAPDDRWWLWSSWWNENWQGKPKCSKKACPSATLSTTNPTWPDLGSNPGPAVGSQQLTAWAMARPYPLVKASAGPEAGRCGEERNILPLPRT
jgi:hypothetical protein